jgi:adenylate kinase
MAKTENEEDTEANEIKAKIEELRDAAVAKIEEAREGVDFGDDGPPEIDREALQIRLPDEMIYNLLRKRLQENDCRNRGYILDGFPRTFKDCNYVFLYKPKKLDENGEEIEEDEPELEEGQEKSFEGYVPDEKIFPHTLLVINQDDEFLINRVKN